MKIRKWLMVIGSLLCSLLLLIWGVQYFFHDHLSSYEITDLSKKEQRLLKTFYANDHIVKGELFDIAYDYFYTYDDYQITLLKKVDGTIHDLTISVFAYQQDKETIKVMGRYPLNQVFQDDLMQDIMQTPHVWKMKGRSLFDVANRHMSNRIKVVIAYRDGKEQFMLEAPHIAIKQLVKRKIENGQPLQISYFQNKEKLLKGDTVWDNEYTDMYKYLIGLFYSSFPTYQKELDVIFHRYQKEREEDCLRLLQLALITDEQYANSVKYYDDINSTQTKRWILQKLDSMEPIIRQAYTEQSTNENTLCFLLELKQQVYERLNGQKKAKAYANELATLK